MTTKKQKQKRLTMIEIIKIRHGQMTMTLEAGDNGGRVGAQQASRTVGTYLPT